MHGAGRSVKARPARVHGADLGKRDRRAM